MREFFETGTEHDYSGKKFRGVKLDEKIIQKIYWDNSIARLGKPKKINISYMQDKAEALLAKSNKRAKFADDDLR